MSKFVASALLFFLSRVSSECCWCDPQTPPLLTNSLKLVFSDEFYPRVLLPLSLDSRWLPSSAYSISSGTLRFSELRSTPKACVFGAGEVRLGLFFAPMGARITMEALKASSPIWEWMIWPQKTAHNYVFRWSMSVLEVWEDDQLMAKQKIPDFNKESALSLVFEGRGGEERKKAGELSLDHVRLYQEKQQSSSVRDTCTFQSECLFQKTAATDAPTTKAPHPTFAHKTESPTPSTPATPTTKAPHPTFAHKTSSPTPSSPTSPTTKKPTPDIFPTRLPTSPTSPSSPSSPSTLTPTHSPTPPLSPTTIAPSTVAPSGDKTLSPTTKAPSEVKTASPTSPLPTLAPSTSAPSPAPTSPPPTSPTTLTPSTLFPTFSPTKEPTTAQPTHTHSPTSSLPPTSRAPSTAAPTSPTSRVCDFSYCNDRGHCGGSTSVPTSHPTTAAPHAFLTTTSATTNTATISNIAPSTTASLLPSFSLPTFSFSNNNITTKSPSIAPTHFPTHSPTHPTARTPTVNPYPFTCVCDDGYYGEACQHAETWIYRHGLALVVWLALVFGVCGLVGWKKREVVQDKCCPCLFDKPARVRRKRVDSDDDDEDRKHDDSDEEVGSTNSARYEAKVDRQPLLKGSSSPKLVAVLAPSRAIPSRTPSARSSQSNSVGAQPPLSSSPRIPPSRGSISSSIPSSSSIPPQVQPSAKSFRSSQSSVVPVAGSPSRPASADPPSRQPIGRASTTRASTEKANKLLGK